MADIVNAMECACSSMGIKLNIKGTPDDPLFQANQIGELLGISNIRGCTRHFYQSHKRILRVDTRGGGQQVTFFTLMGLRLFVAASRKPKAIQIALLLGIDVIPCKISTFEATTLRQIMDAFRGEHMALQFPIGRFLIDLYFPKYKLALECDEETHDSNVQRVRDMSRQAYIQDCLGCEFIRYKPHVTGFCIFRVINQIYTHISIVNAAVPPGIKG